MKIIKPYAEIIYPADNNDVIDIYRSIEYSGRKCYKSKMDENDSELTKKFIRKLIKDGHEAMLEHSNMKVNFIVDRGISHEIVRHRIASFAQESTRYCNYSKDKFGNELTFIEPCFFEKDSPEYQLWESMCKSSEDAYLALIEAGRTPQEARCILPHSLKTELVMTTNIREWRHFFNLRAAGTTGKPHPQMVEVAVPLLKKCQKLMPELFDDIKIDV